MKARRLARGVEIAQHVHETVVQPQEGDMQLGDQQVFVVAPVADDGAGADRPRAIHEVRPQRRIERVQLGLGDLATIQQKAQPQQVGYLATGLGRDGGMAEYMTAPARNLVPLGDADPVPTLAQAWEWMRRRIAPEPVLFVGAGNGVAVRTEDGNSDEGE